MKHFSIRLLLSLICLGLYYQTPLAETTMEKPMQAYTRLYTDANGISHFDEGTLEYTLEDYSPPVPPLALHHFKNAKGATLRHIPTGIFEDWHPAPRRQYMFLLQGIVEVGVSDGEVRRFGPGSIVLLEDLTGKGHTTKSIGDEAHMSVAVPVPQ